MRIETVAIHAGLHVDPGTGARAETWIRVKSL